eukprot:COSAG01_NODE_45142_length_412_cov_0.801917_1_plen_55_part_10
MADAQARIAEIKKKTEEKKAKLVESLGPTLPLTLSFVHLARLLRVPDARVAWLIA